MWGSKNRELQEQEQKHQAEKLQIIKTYENQSQQQQSGINILKQQIVNLEQAQVNMQNEFDSQISEQEKQAAQKLTEKDGVIGGLQQEANDLSDKLQEETYRSEEISESLASIKTYFEEMIESLKQHTFDESNKLTSALNDFESVLNAVQEGFDAFSFNFEAQSEVICQLRQDYQALAGSDRLFHFECIKCYHKWATKKIKPRRCPNCQTRAWNGDKRGKIVKEKAVYGDTEQE